MSNPATVRQLNERMACTYFRQLVLAVEFLHFQSVIHRDIKPANLLLYAKDFIKLADFGVSHMIKDEVGVWRVADSALCQRLGWNQCPNTGPSTQRSSLWVFGFSALCVVCCRRHG